MAGDFVSICMQCVKTYKQCSVAGMFCLCGGSKAFYGACLLRPSLASVVSQVAALGSYVGTHAMMGTASDIMPACVHCAAVMQLQTLKVDKKPVHRIGSGVQLMTVKL